MATIVGQRGRTPTREFLRRQRTLLVALFAGYAVIRWRREFATATAAEAGGGARSEILRQVCIAYCS